METILFTTLGIIVGGIITYFVANYYYKKSIRQKSLTPFLQFFSAILTDIDPEVKKLLKVTYNKKEVSDIYQVQFVIANTGDLPIRDCIEPLVLEVPNNGEVLDVNILHIEPDGREVSYDIIKKPGFADSVSFSFPLLNASEFFIIKLLIKGKLGDAQPIQSGNKETIQSETITFFDVVEKFKFRITVDDLPPIISCRRLPYQYEVEGRNIKFDTTALVFSFIFFLVSACLTYILISYEEIQPSLFLFNFTTFFDNFSPLSFSIIVGWLLSSLLLIGGVAAIVSELVGLKRPRKPKFTIPKELSREHSRFLHRTIF